MLDLSSRGVLPPRVRRRWYCSKIAECSYSPPEFVAGIAYKIEPPSEISPRIHRFATCSCRAIARIDLADFNPLTSTIIKAAVEVHRRLGAGLLESVYRVCFAFELRTLGLQVVEQKKVPVDYKGLRLDCGFHIDFLVNDTVVVEIKSVSAIAPVHEAQLLTYLRLTGRPVGLLINFNVPLLKNGIRRLVNTGSAKE